MNIKNYQEWRIGNCEYTLIMGIVNVTPDSFSDGGQYSEVSSAVKYALKLCIDGADIIDIGGESSRPGADPVSLAKELDRVIPVIEAFRKVSDSLISIDTCKSAVAQVALEVGANIINDISGLTFDQGMAPLAAKYDVPVIIMHMQGLPMNMQKNPQYDNLMVEVIAFFKRQIALAKTAGIKPNNIILDPGIGFGKGVDDNFELIRELGQIVAMGYPVLLGTSRKAFIGEVLGVGVQDRLEGTAATVTAGIMKGARIVRVHDVKTVKRTTLISDRIFRGRN